LSPALLALSLLVGTAACSDDDDPGPEPTTSAESTTSAPAATTTATPAPATTSAAPTPTAAPTPGPTTALPFKANTLPDDGGEGSGNALGLVGVRSARQPGFDRVTFVFGGTGRPGWRVEYVTTPRSDGSGDVVTVKGTAFLQVVLRGVGLPDDTGLAPFGGVSTRLAGSGTKQVLEIAPGSVFEGQQLAFIGMSGAKRPFRVFSLTGPPRVVVDVRDS
jgi:hypothetical protein